MDRSDYVVIALIIVLLGAMVCGIANADHDRCLGLLHRARTHSDTLVVATAGHCGYAVP